MTSPTAAGRQCVKCNHVNTAGLSACRLCLAPLNDTGVVARFEGPPDLRRPLAAGALAGVAALAITVWNTPELRARLVPLHRPALSSTRAESLARPPSSGPEQAVPADAEPAADEENVRIAARKPPRPAKFEPSTGCLLGAYVIQDRNISGRFRRFEELTGKPHASYLRYVGYGQPFPLEWVAELREAGAAPNLALEPNDGLQEVRDDAYLRGFARDAANSGGPVFIRFASEMNGRWTRYHGDPGRYRAAFRLVSRVMREEAPNVAMVWTPYCTPRSNIPSYYPGDDAVDWVGVNIYSVHHHDGELHKPAHREDPLRLLAPIYRRYAHRKPIQVSEYASTHYCKACGEYTADFAMEKMIRMYRGIQQRYPRVKMIYWFSYDTVSGGAAENNYAVTDDPVIRDTYRRLIAPDYFLPRIGPPRAAPEVLEADAGRHEGRNGA